MKAVVWEKKAGVATITLNRPQAMNSLDQALLDDGIAAFEEAERDPEVRVVVLTGAGKAFCAGGDLLYIKENLNTTAAVHRFITQAGRWSQMVFNLKKPVIAMVNGVAAGAGFNLALACDILMCASSARFGQSFAKVGLVPDMGGHYYLPRLVGLAKAKELMFTGKLIDAATAEAMGLVNHVIEDGLLAEKTYALAAELAAGAPLALGLIKRNLNMSLENSLEAVLELEAAAQSVVMTTEDGREGMASFAERRPPKFIGK